MSVVKDVMAFLRRNAFSLPLPAPTPSAQSTTQEHIMALSSFGLLTTALGDAGKLSALVTQAEALKANHSLDADIAFVESVVAVAVDFLPDGEIKNDVVDAAEAGKLIEKRRAARAAGQPLPTA